MVEEWNVLDESESKTAYAELADTTRHDTHQHIDQVLIRTVLQLIASRWHTIIRFSLFFF